MLYQTGLRFICLLAITCSATIAAAAEETPQTAGLRVESPSAKKLGSADQKKKEQLATAAVFLLVLVILACGGLLITIVLWGRRVRRSVRKPTAKVSLGDELWYLKPNKKEATTEPTATQDETNSSATDPNNSDE